MDAFTPLDQSNTSFTSPITDFNMDGWPTDADVWNTFYNFDAFPVVQPSGFANQGVGDGFRLGVAAADPHVQRYTFNNTPTTIDHFGTGGLGPTNDLVGFEHVPVGSANAYCNNMFDSDKTETSELGQGSFNPTWADSTVPYNSDGNNNVLSVTTTSAAPGSSRECSCITCLDLGSEREIWGKPRPVNYSCRLSDCGFSTAVGEYSGAMYAELIARKHEKNHFRHNRQFRCLEDRCVYGAKRWSDLKRHYTSKHCLNPKTKFPCPEIDCKYGGNNGFTRKDKLKSHREKVHEKVAKPEKRFRVSKSNAQGSA